MGTYSNKKLPAETRGRFDAADSIVTDTHVVLVFENKLPGHPDFRIPSKLNVTNILIVFVGLPVAIEALAAWRVWAITRGAMDVVLECVSGDIQNDMLLSFVASKLDKWRRRVVAREPVGLGVHSHIIMAADALQKDDPDLLTMMFGRMGELITRIDLIRRRFENASLALDDAKTGYLESIDALLREDNPSPEQSTPRIACDNRVDHLPRLLLRGESGVGKTLIARHLQGNGRRPVRVVIPEYLGKEDAFEYDLFGYVSGAYTGGREAGSRGLLLENLGGVVFLDEIGEANPTIQAKLLAYLDDYRVRPRGWQYQPFYCPTLIVAATNRNLDELVASGDFRGDLLARFTDEETIPPLRERTESLPYILDCLLQRESINCGGAIQELGSAALDMLLRHEYKRGNFRQLEDLLRGACERARRDGRDQVCVNDLGM